MSISAVAREAGVSHALIHNHYPKIAEKIRKIQNRIGAIDRERRDIEDLRQRNSRLRAVVKDQGMQIARLASLNETLLIQNRMLKLKCDE
jgi:AcrR family transcriptional regulator